jgi:hypothetical protein
MPIYIEGLGNYPDTRMCGSSAEPPPSGPQGTQDITAPAENIASATFSTIRQNTEGELIFVLVTMYSTTVAPNEGSEPLLVCNATGVFATPPGAGDTIMDLGAHTSPINPDERRRVGLIMVPKDYYWAVYNGSAESGILERYVVYKLS